MGAVAQTEVMSCAAAAVCHRWTRGVATQAVRAGRQAAAGPWYAGWGVTYNAAHPLHSKHRVWLDGIWVGGEVNVNGCRGDDPGT